MGENIYRVDRSKVVSRAGNPHAPGLHVTPDRRSRHNLVVEEHFNSYETGDGDFFGGASTDQQAKACNLVCRTLCTVFEQCQPDIQIKNGGWFHKDTISITGAQVANGPCELKDTVILQSNFETIDGKPALDSSEF